MTSTFSSRFDKVVSDSEPLCAIVGAGDLAVEKLREAREKLDAQELKELKEQAQAKLHAGVEALQSDIRLSPDQLSDLPVRLQAAVNDLLASSSTTYDELVARGRQLVGAMRHQPEQQAAADGTVAGDVGSGPDLAESAEPGTSVVEEDEPGSAV